MNGTENHTLVLVKSAKRQLQPKVIQSNLVSLLESVNTKSLKVSGWTVAPAVTNGDQVWYREGDGERGYTYSIRLVVTFAHDSRSPEAHEFPSIQRRVHVRASQPNFGSWALGAVDEAEWDATIAAGDIAVDPDMLGYAEIEIPEDFESEFAHLYGLNAHVARIRSAIEAGMMSGWANRYHVALEGPPGCGKSDICASLKRALGNDAVLEFDATATTAAGAIKELAEREILPRILLVEEIEKADEKSLAFLLAVCDLRGEIRKTTARATIQRDTKLLVIATVNDHELFGRLQAGALASRFANKIFFKRPTREQLRMILEREVAKVNGDEEWIDPALDYCAEQEINDPRMVTALCLCGRDMLITGEYQQMLRETAPESASGKATVSA
jgi:hypothetical protein